MKVPTRSLVNPLLSLIVEERGGWGAFANRRITIGTVTFTRSRSRFSRRVNGSIKEY